MTDSSIKNSPSTISFSPIGYLESDQKYPYQASRQPDELSQSGIIHLRSGENFEQALTDLEGCSHLWIVYHFNQNSDWKPLVQTPRSNKKIGVFATRAPYRPNPIGLSVVSLIQIKGLKIFIGPNDLLDQTPILDIKPYLAEADRIENSEILWLKNKTHPKLKINFSPLAENQIEFLESKNLTSLRPFILRQLEYDPLNSDKKRVIKNESGYHTLSYRTWRIDFLLIDQTISILSLRSGYSDSELGSDDDLYQDKKIHLDFLNEF